MPFVPYLMFSADRRSETRASTMLLQSLMTMALTSFGDTTRFVYRTGWQCVKGAREPVGPAIGAPWDVPLAFLDLDVAALSPSRRPCRRAFGFWAGHRGSAVAWYR